MPHAGELYSSALRLTRNRPGSRRPGDWSITHAGSTPWLAMERSG